MDQYFKYLSPGGARPTLTNGTLRWSRPSMFNDLFDMAVPYSADFDENHVKRLALDLMWDRIKNPGARPPMNEMGVILEMLAPQRLWQEREAFDDFMGPGVEEALAKFPEHLEAFNKDVIEHLKTIKVLCLSKVKDNNMMWGLYADKHRGLALEFGNANGVDSVYKLAKPVTYCDEAPAILDDDELANFLAGNIRLTPEQVDPLMYLKSKHWSHEEELRIVTGEGRSPGVEFEDCPFHPRELVAVYYGARGAELRAELDPVVAEKYPNAQRWQALQGEGLKMDFVLLD